jgi:2,4-dienoyl-CoA reductase (NADPH2)
MEKGEMRYPHIFLLEDRKLEIKNNKICCTETNLTGQTVLLQIKSVGYMEAQAKGGAGIVTTQGAYPDEKR